MRVRSPAFARMKAALIALIADIPAGKVAQVGDVGVALNIPPRHVAYILSQLAPDETALLPWYRVVPILGKFPVSAKRSERQARQIKFLTLEGVAFDDDHTIASVQSHLFVLPTTHANTFWADED